MNLRKWVFPVSLYFGALVILFATFYINGLASDKQLNYANMTNVSATQVNQTAGLQTQNQAKSESQNAPESGTRSKIQLETQPKTQTQAQASSPDLNPGESSTKTLVSTQGAEAGFKCPVQGEVLRAMGNYYAATLQGYVYHAGVDYSEPEGAVIRAGHQGVVTFAGKDVLLGGRVTLDCGDGWQVTYGGLENLRVQERQTIRAGQALGQVGFDPGNEGQGRPQLHYEVWHDNEPVKP